MRADGWVVTTWQRKMGSRMRASMTIVPFVLWGQGQPWAHQQRQVAPHSLPNLHVPDGPRDLHTQLHGGLAGLLPSALGKKDGLAQYRFCFTCQSQQEDAPSLGQGLRCGPWTARGPHSQSVFTAHRDPACPLCSHVLTA